MNRTLAADSIKSEGSRILLSGRVQTIRDHGKVFFLDIIDESATIQAVSRKKFAVSPGDIVKISGVIKKRPASLVNINLKTGTIEVEIEDLKIVSKSQTPPIPTGSNGYDVDEDLRLKYRYLDLRRPRLQKNLRLRHQVATIAREFLNEEGFIEIETPYLSKTTPEGSRDFLVPSRLNKGKFYALTQSPQQYKQLLMIAGFEKYYQFARAFRDEDLRADRQFEHTQIDIEMAYVKREDVMKLVERMYKFIAKSISYKVHLDPFPVFTHYEAIKKFGQDKFDLRENPPHSGKDEGSLAFAWVTEFPLLKYDKVEKRYTFSHNPFCAPKEEDVADLMAAKRLARLLSYQYDLVLNGQEIGGGSIRITDPKIQRQVFKVMGYSPKQIDEDFGHILDAYNYGAPPHGGIALGLDRFCAILAGEKSIREVIAFPASGSGTTSVMEAPSPVQENTLKELGLKKI